MKWKELRDELNRLLADDEPVFFIDVQFDEFDDARLVKLGSIDSGRPGAAIAQMSSRRIIYPGPTLERMLLR